MFSVEGPYQGPKLAANTKLRAGANGNYIWMAEVDRFADRTTLRLLLLATLLAAAVSGLIIFGLNIVDSGLLPALIFLLQYLLIAGAGAMVLSLLIFFAIYIPVVGRRALVVYDMRPDGIQELFLEKNARREDIRFNITQLAAGTVEGTAGLLDVRRERFTAYDDLTKAVLRPGHGTMMLVGRDLSRTRVASPRQDFDFVTAYIFSHCPSPVTITQKH